MFSKCRDWKYSYSYESVYYTLFLKAVGDTVDGTDIWGALSGMSRHWVLTDMCNILCTYTL